MIPIESSKGGLMKTILLLGLIISSNAFSQDAKCVLIETDAVTTATATQTPLRPEFDQPTLEEVAAVEEPLKNLSATEKLKAYRTKLEAKNLILLEKKMEMIRLEQEMALLRTLEKSMNKTLSAIEAM